MYKPIIINGELVTDQHEIEATLNAAERPGDSMIPDHLTEEGNRELRRILGPLLDERLTYVLTHRLEMELLKTQERMDKLVAIEKIVEGLKELFK